MEARVSAGRGDRTGDTGSNPEKPQDPKAKPNRSAPETIELNTNQREGETMEMRHEAMHRKVELPKDAWALVVKALGVAEREYVYRGRDAGDAERTQLMEKAGGFAGVRVLIAAQVPDLYLKDEGGA